MRNLLTLLVFVVTHVSAVDSEPIIFEYENDITNRKNLEEGVDDSASKNDEIKDGTPIDLKDDGSSDANGGL